MENNFIELFHGDLENKVGKYQEFLSFVFSEILTLKHSPSMILGDGSLDNFWGNDQINELGFRFMNSLLEESSDLAKYLTIFPACKYLSLKFHVYINDILQKQGNLVLVSYEIKKSNYKVKKINAKSRKIADKILQGLNDLEKKVLYKFWFVQDEMPLKMVCNLIGMDVEFIQKTTDKINKLFADNFHPKNFDEFVKFLEMFTRIPEVADNMVELQESIVTHPLIIFLENAGDCLPYDLLKRYKANTLTELTKVFLGDHIEECDKCKKKMESFSTNFVVDTNRLDKIDFSKFQNKFEIVENGVDLAPLQIWSTKNEIKNLDDVFYNTHYPCAVLIVTDAGVDLDDEPVIRVRPISMITEFKSIGDVHIEDRSYFGQSFIIENWNERPMFVSALDKYLGTINKEEVLNNLASENTEYPKKVISKFQSEEIENVRYLSSPVLDEFFF